jgi:hypothetical protein
MHGTFLIQIDINQYTRNETNLMHHLYSVYWVTTTLRVSGLLVAHHEVPAMYTCDNWYVLYVLRLIHTYHAVPLPCRATKGLDCIFPSWFTQCGRVWFTYAMARPCRARAMPRPCLLKATSQGHGTARHGHGMGELASVVQRRHVGDLPAFGCFGLPRGVPRNLSKAYQSVNLYG